MRSGDDVVADLLLVDADAPVAGSGAGGLTTFDLANYRPLPYSPLVDAGTDGTTLGALEPLPDEPPPPPPPPPPVDVAELVRLAQAAVAELGDLTAHGSATLDDLALLLSNVAAAKAEVDEINRHAGETRLRLDDIMAALDKATAA
jgi:hypothetical protein